MRDQLLPPLRRDPGVIAVRAPDTEGNYLGTKELALDHELTVKGGWDPTEWVGNVMTQAEKGNQDAAFVSKVLREGEQSKNWRPGLEVYFDPKAGDQIVPQLASLIDEAGLAGYTVIVDPRAGNRVVGIRTQWAPEYAVAFGGADPANLEAMREQTLAVITDLIEKASSLEGVSRATAHRYDTVFAGRGGYGAFVPGKAPGGRGSPVWFGQPLRQNAERAGRLLQGQQWEDPGAGFLRGGGTPDAVP
jgi:hypothetical protein